MIMKLNFNVLKQQFKYCDEQELKFKLSNSIFEGELLSDDIWKISIPYNRPDLSSLFAIACELRTHNNALNSYAQFAEHGFSGVYNTDSMQVNLMAQQLQLNGIKLKFDYKSAYFSQEVLAAFIYFLYNCPITLLCDSNNLLIKSNKHGLSYETADKNIKQKFSIIHEPIDYHQPDFRSEAMGWLHYITNPLLRNTTATANVYKANHKLKSIPFSYDQLQDLLGIKINKQYIVDIIANINGEYDCESSAVQVPSYRSDLQISEDIIELIAHQPDIHTLLTTSISHHPTGSFISLSQQKSCNFNHYRNHLYARGYIEVKHYSFVHAKDNQLLDNLFWYRGKLDPVILHNPMSKAQNEMRLSCLPGLIKSANDNLKYGYKGFKLFELGKSFCKPREEYWTIAGIMHQQGEQHTYYYKPSLDVPTILGDIEGILPQDYLVYRQEKGLHITVNQKPIGCIFHIDGGLTAFEIDIKHIKDMPSQIKTEFSRLPHVNKVLSVTCSLHTDYQQIVNFITQQDINELVKIGLQDIYIQDNHKVISLALAFNSPHHTLDSSLINDYMARLESAVTTEFSINET